MKKITKTMCSVLLAGVITAGALAMSGCGEPASSLELNENMITESKDIVLDLNTSYYNQLTASTHYTLDELEREKSDYYVLVGTLNNIEDMSSVTFGDVKFEEDKNISLSVGLNAFIDAAPYYVEDNKLYVAAPILAVETVGKDKIKINDKEYDITKNSLNKLQIKSVGFSGNQNTVTGSGTTYNLNMKTTKEFVVFGIKDMTVNTNIALTRYLYTSPEGTKTISYGLTAADDTYDSVYGVGLYALKYNATDISVYNGATAKFGMFFIDKDGRFLGVTDDLTLNITTVTPETDNTTED